MVQFPELCFRWQLFCCTSAIITSSRSRLTINIFTAIHLHFMYSDTVVAGRLRKKLQTFTLYTNARQSKPGMEIIRTRILCTRAANEIHFRTYDSSSMRLLCICQYKCGYIAGPYIINRHSLSLDTLQPNYHCPFACMTSSSSSSLLPVSGVWSGLIVDSSQTYWGRDGVDVAWQNVPPQFHGRKGAI